MVVASGNRVLPAGVINTFPFTFDGTHISYIQVLVITNCKYDLLIGADILKTYNCVIDYNRNKLLYCIE